MPRHSRISTARVMPRREIPPNVPLPGPGMAGTTFSFAHRSGCSTMATPNRAYELCLVASQVVTTGKGIPASPSRGQKNDTLGRPFPVVNDITNLGRHGVYAILRAAPVAGGQ